MLFTWLGAGGTLGRAFQQLMAVQEMSNYRGDDRQPLKVINYAKLCVKHLGGHAWQFFGSDGRDESQRLGKSAEGMLAAWREAVPTVTQAFGEGTPSFMAALGRLPKAGPLLRKRSAATWVCPFTSVTWLRRFPLALAPRRVPDFSCSLRTTYWMEPRLCAKGLKIACCSTSRA